MRSVLRARRAMIGGAIADENPLWLVVLSDLMTNLMLFFLVLYAFTRQPEADRKRMMQRLSSSFQGEETPSQKEERAAEVVQQVNEQAAAEALKKLVDPKEADVLVSEKLIRVRMPSGLFFGSGSAKLTFRAARDLDPIGKMLKALPNPIIIEGHTDNVRIAKGDFKTNWDLSAARAASVMRRFVYSLGIPQDRFVIAGYGEQRPVAPNDSPEGRAKNRRIEIVVVRKGGA